MKKTILSLFAAFTAFVSVAQLSPDYEVHYRQLEPVSNDDITIEIDDHYSQAEYCKFRMKITNKTGDYIVIKTEEIEMVMDHGTYHPIAKTVIIDPFKSASKTIQAEGDNRFQVDKYTLNLKGFYKVPAKGNVAAMDNFKLPATKNDFEGGNFMCKVDGEITKETKVTEVPLTCKYNGNSIAIIDPSKCVVKLESGQEYATTNRGPKIKLSGNDNIVMPGEDKKVKAVFEVPAKIVDMQFANMEIVWKETFTESKLVPMTIESQSIEKDPGLTEGKNR